MSSALITCSARIIEYRACVPKWWEWGYCGCRQGFPPQIPQHKSAQDPFHNPIIRALCCGVLVCLRLFFDSDHPMNIHWGHLPQQRKHKTLRSMIATCAWDDAIIDRNMSGRQAGRQAMQASAGKQACRQAGRQAGKQAGKQASNSSKACGACRPARPPACLPAPKHVDLYVWICNTCNVDVGIVALCLLNVLVKTCFSRGAPL